MLEAIQSQYIKLDRAFLLLLLWLRWRECTAFINDRALVTRARNRRMLGGAQPVASDGAASISLMR
jgi:hypothetical protein